MKRGDTLEKQGQKGMYQKVGQQLREAGISSEKVGGGPRKGGIGPSLQRGGGPQRSEEEGVLEAGVSPGRSGVHQGGRGSLGRQGVPKRWGVALREVRSLRKVEGPPEKGTPLKKVWVCLERRGPQKSGVFHR